MWKLIFSSLVISLSIVSAAVGEVSIRVCEKNGQTPFDGREIMVGTKLTIIVNSDTNGYWPCDVAVRGKNRNYGVLSARDYNESTGHYDGSIFKAAIDKEGYVYLWHDDIMEIDGFSYTGDPCAVAGDWFIIDYNATSVGDCNVGLYEWFSTEPTYEVSFSQVRSRDFNRDTKVDFTDFAIFASYWQTEECNEPNWCQGTDLDTDGDVDINDLRLFAEYWLKTTEYNVRSRDFNRDAKVDFTDFTVFASHWQETNCRNPDWCEGTDLDTNGSVDINDLMLFCQYWLGGTQ